MSNQTFGRSTNPVTQWKRFDALPASLREVYARAPFDYAITPAIVTFCRENPLSVATLRRHTIEFMAADIMKDARKTYGPDHPDAQISRLAGRQVRA